MWKFEKGERAIWDFKENDGCKLISVEGELAKIGMGINWAKILFK